MAPAKGRSQRFAEFEERPAKDYDPEAEGPVQDSDDSDSEGGSDELDGTEHYVSVGKSKLRQSDPVSLGPQYSGKRVSRAALDESSDGSEDDAEDDEDDEDGDDDEDDGDSGSEEFDDPETADLEADHVDDDAEIDSDDALCESDKERFAKFTFRGSARPQLSGPQRRKRPTAADFLTDSEEEDDSDGEQPGGALSGVSGHSDAEEDVSDDEDELSGPDGAGESVSGSDDSDGDDDEDENDTDEDDDEDEDEDDDNNGRAELRKIMSESQKGIVATMSQAAKADVDKGRAVRQQRRSFDSLLNIRIRLQKALVAANSLSTVPESDRESTGEEAYQAAEEAALKLWSTIETFRRSLAPASSSSAVSAGQKRKREAGPETPLEELWEDMEAIESRAASHRKKVLEKWSEKVRSTTAVATSRKLGSNAVQPLTSVLDDQLAQSERLVKRTRVPRSCAPVQAAKKVEEDAGIYDDADFYQLLLKELVDQRTMDSSSGGGGGAGGPSAIPTVRWGAAVREAKTRKVVDRRASKGRKLRFTVHEKLQNFMAPEDRRAWEQEAIDRFFGTLFGQKMELREDDEAGSEDDEMGGVSLEDQGLRLFK